MRNNKTPLGILVIALAILAISLASVMAAAMFSVFLSTPKSDQPTVVREVPDRPAPDRPDEELPKDHPILAAPNLLLSPPNQRPRHVKTLSTPYEGNAPIWTFAPDKTHFALGETITGKITVENTEEQKGIRFSPAYRGFLVATVGVWVARRDEKTGWGKLEPVFPVNRGMPYYAEQLQGEAVVLAPRGKWQAALPVNGLAYFTDDGSKRSRLPRWLGGFGFTEPGQYRFYLQYVNLERTIPFQHRWPFDGEGPGGGPLKHFRESPLLDLGPVVLGPFEVEVVALKGGDAGQLSECFREWTNQYRHPDFDYQRHRITNTKPMPDLLKLKSLQAEPLSSVRDSLALTQYQAEMAKLPKDADERGRALSALIVKMQDARRKLPRGWLYDAYGLTECYARNLLGKTDQALALALAEELATPDAKVFLADYTPKPAVPKGGK